MSYRDREEINKIFNDLAFLAGSRAESWAAIAACNRKYGRIPTLGEVVDYITNGEALREAHG
jgi:hypothetical protein